MSIHPRPPFVAPTLRARLRSESGAFDIASIIVGVLVLAVVSLGIAVSLTAVVPWAQDKAARADLGAVHTAQSVVKARDGAYAGAAQLKAAGVTGDMPAGVQVYAENAGAGYCAEAASSSGKKFRATAVAQTPVQGNCEVTLQWSRFDSATAFTKLAASSDGQIIVRYSTTAQISRNAGATWATLTMPSTNPYSIAVSDEGETIIAGYRSAAAAISRDGGATWVRPSGMNASGVRSDVAMSRDGRTMLLMSSANVFVSRDAGMTWTATLPSSSNYRAPSMSANGDSIIVNVNAANSKFSSDGGQTWRNIPPSASGTGYSYLAAFSADSSTVVAVFTNTGVGSSGFMVSTDSGSTWKVLNTLPSGSWSSVQITDDGTTVLAVGSLGAFMSRDLGATWSQSPDFSGSTGGFMSKDGQRFGALAGGFWTGELKR